MSRQVTREQLNRFLDDYEHATGRKLQADVYRIGQPEQIQYNDFWLGDWPESVVAYRTLEDDERCAIIREAVHPHKSSPP